MVLWGRSVLVPQKVPRKVSPRFHRGSAKVSRRLRKFGDLSGLLGQIPFCRGSPHHFFTFASQFLHLFFACFWTELALGSSAIVKVLWQNDTFVFWFFLQQMALASQKVLWECSPNCSVHFSHNLLWFFGQLAVASEKVLWRVPPTVLYIYLPVSRGQSCVNSLTCLTHTLRFQQKTTHPVLAVGAFLGLICARV